MSLKTTDFDDILFLRQFLDALRISRLGDIADVPALPALQKAGLKVGAEIRILRLQVVRRALPLEGAFSLFVHLLVHFADGFLHFLHFGQGLAVAVHGRRLLVDDQGFTLEGFRLVVEHRHHLGGAPHCIIVFRYFKWVVGLRGNS